MIETTPWILLLVLYLLGIVGFRATGYDLNNGPWHTWRPYVALAFWPVTVAYGGVGDFYDWMRGRR